MTQFDDTNRGVLFKNDKEGNEKRPDYTGSINVGGQEFWLSAWIRESQKGAKFMSLSITEKEQKPASKTHQPVQEPELEDDIPF
jgi:uncharacterized protein (DUF736 family)